MTLGNRTTWAGNRERLPNLNRPSCSSTFSIEGTSVRRSGPHADYRLPFATQQPSRYREVYQRLKDAIMQGVYPHGARVPSIRTLASELGLSRATIEKAYDLLIGEGLLVSHGQSGTKVAYVRPRKPIGERAPSLADRLTSEAASPEDTIPTKAVAGGQIVRGTGIAPFQIWVPAIDLFPRAAWLKISQRILRDRAAISEVIDDVQGYYELRTAICGYLSVARGVRCGPHQVFITSGYRQSLGLLTGALVPSQSSVWIEDPGYLPTGAVLEQFGMRAIPVPVDAEGLNVDVGRQNAHEARMAITTPTKQSPLGVSMSLRRRNALIDWAVEGGAWIVEDDYDNEFCFEGKHLPTLQNLDVYGRTFYLGTFSKTLHPNLRIAYVVAPEPTVASLRQAARNMLDGTSILQQKVMAAFIADGHFALHLKRSRGVCAARRKALIDTLTSKLGSRLSICQKSCGLHLFAKMNGTAADEQICEAARSRGLAVTSLSSRYMKAEARHGLLLGYANFTNDAQLARSVELLEECLYDFQDEDAAKDAALITSRGPS